jgi:hypothetical protein
MRLFTEQEINDIYDQYVKKPDDYYTRYDHLPSPDTRLPLVWNSWEGHDFPRVRCILEFRDWVVKHNIPTIKKFLSTCASDPEIDVLNIEQFYHAPYYDGNHDLHTLNLNVKDFKEFMSKNKNMY